MLLSRIRFVSMKMEIDGRVGLQREIGSSAMLATAQLIVLPAAWMPTAAHLQYAGLRMKT